MFLDFFLLLKNDGFPVSLKEYLTFLEALDRDVIGYDPTDFYYLSRCVMVKDERHLDRFDRLFPLTSGELSLPIPGSSCRFRLSGCARISRTASPKRIRI